MKLPLHFLIDDIICQLSHWKNSQEFKRMRTESGDYSLKGFDQLKCIYIHIPKAAGISINKALFDNYGGGHKTVRTYKRIFGPAVYRQYFSFTFVRNPYTRLFSAYRFLKNGGFNKRDANWAAEHFIEFSTFDEFVCEWVSSDNIWKYDHFKPQHSFVCDVNSIPEVDFVGRVENIDNDFRKVCEILDIENNLEQHNKTEKDFSHWRNAYTQFSLDKVNDIYHKDFELFGYPKIGKSSNSKRTRQTTFQRA